MNSPERQQEAEAIRRLSDTTTRLAGTSLREKIRRRIPKCPKTHRLRHN